MGFGIGSFLKRVKGSLRTKIIAWFFVPTAIILVTAALANFYAFQQVADDLVIERDRDLTRLSAGQLAAELSEYTDILNEVARTAGFLHGQTNAHRTALEQEGGLLVVFDGGVLILNNFGIVSASTSESPEQIGQNWSGYPFFRQLVRSGAPVFSDVLSLESSEEEIIAVAVPIIGSNGENLGSVVGTFQLAATGVSSLYGGIIRLRIGETGGMYIVDGQGRVIFHSETDRIGSDYSGQLAVQQVLGGRTGAIRMRNINDEDTFAAFAMVPGTSWGLVSEESWAALTSDAQGFQSKFLLLFVAIGVGVPMILVTIGLSRFMTPIQDLIEGAKEIAAGNFQHKININSGDEILELADQFNAMAGALGESYGELEQRVTDRTSDLQAREEESRQLASENAVMAEIGRVISSSLNIDEVYEGFAQQVGMLISFDRIDVTFANIEEGLVTQAYSTGTEASGRQRGDVYGLVGTATDAICRTRNAMLFHPKDDLQVAREFPGLQPAFASGQRSFVGSPLISGNGVIGALFLASTQPNAYTNRDLALTQRVASEIAGAIANSNLYAELQEAQETVRDLAVLEERNRMSREIHDTLAQGFTGIILQLEAGEQAIDGGGGDAMDHISKAKDLAKNSLQEARRSVWELLPKVLEDKQLGVALQDEVDRFSASESINAIFNVTGENRPLKSAAQTTLLRICQEALHNISKHARATEVAVGLTFLDGRALMSVRDNGVGFDVTSLEGPNLEGGFGLTGMEQRAQIVGGTLKITSAKGEGTTVEVTIPIS